MKTESDEDKMVRLVTAYATGEGYSASRLDGVQFIKLSDPLPRHPVIYNPGILIVAQGRKTGYIGNDAYTYNPDNYLALAAPLPFECELPDPTHEKPFLALFVGVDYSTLGELVLGMDKFLPGNETPSCIHTCEITPELKSAAVRLLECLNDPMESCLLGKQIVREIVYRVLNGPQGWALRALIGLSGNFRQINRALQIIHSEYKKNLDVDSLAKATNMSTSGFHHAFKTLTATSPIQYIKSIRLHRARAMMVQEGYNVNVAASEVGYSSPAHFSREFKRFFGKSPKDEAVAMRKYGLPSLWKPDFEVEAR